MNKAMPLKGLRALVTRPKQQSRKLCRLIEAQGGVAVSLPTVAIESNPNHPATERVLAGLAQYDTAIFVSRNAVSRGLKLLGKRRSELARLRLLAVGPATAATLARALPGQTVVNGAGNSETLLSIDALSAVAGRKIIIFRGNGGRELLAKTLRARGAQVDYAAVYRRVCPHYEQTVLQAIWNGQPPNVVIVTSNNGLENLLNLLDEQQRNLVRAGSLLVVGTRIRDFALTLGFTRLLIAPASGNNAIIDTLIAHFPERLADHAGKD